MPSLQKILLGELNPQWFSEFDTIIATKIDGEFSLKSKASFAVKTSRVGLDFPYNQGEYFCDISKAFQDRENYCYPEGMDLPTKKQLLVLRKEWAENYIDRINYPEI
jgi:hypothetical protein